MSGLPHKLNLVTIKIQQAQLGSANTYVDPDFSEPASPITFDSEITLEGQVNLMSKDYLNMLRTMTGDQGDTRGHLVLRNPVKDTSGNSITLQKGDKITEIAGVSVDFYVFQIRPESPLDGVFLLKYVVFGENPIARESR